MLTLALSSWSFHRHLPYFGSGSWSPPRQEGKELSILDFPEVAASHGITQIEICQAHLESTSPGYLARVRAAVDAAGCRVVNVPIDVGRLAEPDPERRRAELQSILSWIDAAWQLGSPAARVNTGGAPDQDPDETLEMVAEGYRQLAAHCAERNMMILLENHGGLSASPQAIVRLLEKVDAPNFRLCPDFGNFPDGVREEGIRLMLPHAAIVHAKVLDIDENGQHSRFDLARCLALVEQSGFSGPLSIEYSGTGDEYQGVTKGKAFIESHVDLSSRDEIVRQAPRRVAIFGAGMIANRHVSAWRKAGAEVVAAVDINPEVLEAFGDQHGIPLRETDYAALLQGENAGAFEIVDICSPPWLHAPMAIAALEAGKHVLAEKPFALTAAEADAMADAADRAGKVIACRQGGTRLSWQVRTVRDIVQSGVLGDVYFMRLIGRSLYRPGIEYNPAARWFLDRSKAGGGALYDWGVYDLDILFSVFGPLDVTETTAVTFTGVDSPELTTPFDVEEHAAAMFKLRDGTAIYWERGWASHLPEEHRWDFYGSKAGLSFVPHSNVLGLDLNLRVTRYSPGQEVELPLPPLAPPGPDVYEDFLLAVAGERAPAVSGRECAAMLRVIEGVYASAESRVLAEA